MRGRKNWLIPTLAVMVLVVGMFVLAVGTGAFAPPLQTEDDGVVHLPVTLNDLIPPTAIPSPTSTQAATSTPGATPTPGPSPTPYPTRPPGDTIVIDHRSVDDFERIPEQYIEAARQMRMIFIDRSVGSNISDGLTCLSYASDEQAPSHCVRDEHVVPEFSVAPSVLNWSRPGGYDRSNWEFQFSSDSCDGGGWMALVPCFIDMVGPSANNYDVMSFQFSYLAVGDDSSIAEQPGGYFWDNNNDNIGDVYMQEAFEAQHPNKVFIYWTTSLARGIGNSVSTEFNEMMRDYAIANDKPLFDVADILSHDPDGNPCYDNRDGVPYDNGNNSENYPNDGHNYPAICQHYTTETDGGHLGRVSAGKIRVAKAFWVLMARIAGWNG